MTTYPKRLIEVDLPIKRISAHARREQCINKSHIKIIHTWWARRPLAACRAVICAALWPDPAPGKDDAPCPPAFIKAAKREMLAWTPHERQELLSEESRPRFEAARRNPKKFDDHHELRRALLDFIADFANWDNSTVPEYLATSRELTQTAHEALGGAPGTKPLVVDPFAGGGSIPLEALRVGADAFASDLNPVAMVLNKVSLEYIPKRGEKLAKKFREHAEKVKKAAYERLREFYPADKNGGVPIAFIWARTVISEAPAQKRGADPVEVPLLRSMCLSEKAGTKVAFQWARDKRGFIKCKSEKKSFGALGVHETRRPLLEIVTLGKGRSTDDATVKGGSATCPITHYTTAAKAVKSQLIKQNGGADYGRLLAVLLEGPSGRKFRIANDSDVRAFENAQGVARTLLKRDPSAFPVQRINPIRPYKNTRGLSAVTRIGCDTFNALYNRRQALCMVTFIDCIGKHFGSGKLSEEETAVKTLLALAIGRMVYANTSISRWDSSRSTIKGAFSKQALAVVWDYAEANPFSGASADWDGGVEMIAKALEANSVVTNAGTVVCAPAAQSVLPANSAAALITDPPYFAAIPYSDLSDFFFVWMRRVLANDYPDLFTKELTDQRDELIVTNAHKGRNDKIKDELFFTTGMTQALKVGREEVTPDGIAVIVYAESTTAGWEAVLQAIISGGWVVTSSWPIDTEMENRTRAQSAASLQSSIHLVCRPRENRDGSLRKDDVGDWRDVLAELPKRIHDWMPRLAEEGVVGADAIFACLGPALEVYSRYARVEKPGGETVTLKEYLVEVWAAVAKEALTLVFSGADATGFEEDARLTAMWLWTLSTNVEGGEPSDGGAEDDTDDEESAGKAKKAGGYVLEYDAARMIAQGLGAHLEDLTHTIEVMGEKARLLPVAERTRYLFGKDEADAPKRRKKRDDQMTLKGIERDVEEAAEEGGWGEKTAPKAGSTVLDRVHQAMILFAAGRGEAMKRFLVEEGIGNDNRFWKLAQALSALYPPKSDEKRWVDGVLARKKGLGF